MTTVEWLKQKTSDMTIHKTHLNDTISEWQDGYNVALEDVIKLLNQAIEMEKQQIKNAFQYKFLHPYVENEPEKYYNETFKNKTK